MAAILLVRPEYLPEEMKVSGLYSGATECLGVKSFMSPLDIATVAALTPDDVEVDLWDEAVHGQINDSTPLKKYDLVGVTGFITHWRRATRLARIFRSQGIRVAAGGPGVSGAPQHYRDHFDILFIGEAEYLWPQLVADLKAGTCRPEYRQVTRVNMDDSPLPRWTGLADHMKEYFFGGVQTTRGCPFDCEFCDVPNLLGRVPRHKRIDRVLEEVVALTRLEVNRIFFTDDNFYSTPRYAKDLLRELISLNRSFQGPIQFITQITLNIAKDEEMLTLLADANLNGLLIGIETPNTDSLVETNKPQNFKTDMLHDVKRIQSYGLSIKAGLIVGFDHDDTSIFERQFEFLQEACIPNPQLAILKAAPGTKLWVRLHQERRVFDIYDIVSSGRYADFTPITNIIPKRMSTIQLLDGYRDLMEKMYDWGNFEKRVKGMISRVTRRPKVKQGMGSKREVFGFLRFCLFHMDRTARATTLRLLSFTLRHAPFMLKYVVIQIMNNHAFACKVDDFREVVALQIELLSQHKVTLEADSVILPPTFAKPYKGIFPELYERARSGLVDKARTHETLITATCDFLTRVGPASVGQFDAHHRDLLLDCCDRAIWSENNDVHSGSNGPIQKDAGAFAKAEIKEMALRRLAEDVLRAVQDQLWRQGGRRETELFNISDSTPRTQAIA
jgi:radical SAM superfamily enzyme YgiQ (UPF0313 family)